MVSKVEQGRNNGHELAPLNTRANGDGHHGVTIVLQGSRGSLQRPDVDMEPGEDRAAWSGKLQFFLSIIGYSVGLGNIWRFPYLCQQNGGGAFLIPFVFMLVLEGIPLFLIEMAIGQKMRLGALGVWNTIHPWLGGIGISSCVVTLLIALYYNVIITWVLFYLFNSFQSPLPWASCPVVNGTPVSECVKSSETAYFWYRNTLDAAPSMDDSGGLKWWIVLCLLLSWIMVFLIVMKGIQSSGKVVYFTSMFPYLVLTIFFIRGITLKGAGAGLMHMYTPKVEKLLDPTVWLDAATQVFYSFGLAFGSLIAFGSYNPPKNNCVRDVILVSVCNAITAIYASVVIFAILGFKAMANVDKCVDMNKVILFDHGAITSRNVSTEIYDSVMDSLENKTFHTYGLEVCSLSKELDEAAEGTGLAFIVFTQAIVELPGAPFWSIIFFMMLLSLGLGSQIGILEGMLCTIFDIDIFKRIRKPYVTGAVCVFCFFVGLIFTTGAGEYWLKMFDSFAGTIGLVVVALMEMISVIYVYGHERFTNDIYEMTGYRPGLYWQITWRFIGPVIMFCILGSSIVFMFLNPPKYSAWNADLGAVVSTAYPSWVMAIAIAMITAGVLPIPVVLILRRMQCLQLDVNIHQGSIRRIETTVSTKEMMDDQDDDDDMDSPAHRLADFDNNSSSDEEGDGRGNLRPPRMLMTTPKKAFKMEIVDDY
ncbi:sodium-dependent neutral amino acid transporter B(0)AT3 [Arctopsyche grandis]|uniref:sodium-dependent neutral amino acid transporter B(0)AT3 n=1 Tax=Arctopsyche grandis TaxID=121162 RepID=UPI00406D98C6